MDGDLLIRAPTPCDRIWAPTTLSVSLGPGWVPGKLTEPEESDGALATEWRHSGSLPSLPTKPTKRPRPPSRWRSEAVATAGRGRRLARRHRSGGLDGQIDWDFGRSKDHPN